MLLAILPMIVCGPCHAGIVARYSTTPMANTSGPVEPAKELSGGFFHPASATRFDIVKSDGRLYLQWGHHRQPFDFFIGSRRMGRSYGFADDGYFFQAPVGYYANRHLWDMAPGYENDRHPDLNRPITADCLFCHATGAKAVPKTLNRFADLSALRGISCERCHGDASAHLAHPQSGNIVNPRRLSFAERDSICEQCHLAGEARVPQPGRQLADFRPGQRLSAFLAIFVRNGGPAGIRVTSHAEALAASRCRQASGEKLWCGTCHDPHAQQVNYREKCLGCHSLQACPVSRRESHGAEADCIGCHMGKGRAYDGGHTVFTDHSIPRRPANSPSRKLAPDSLASYFPPDPASPAADRNLGIAWAQLAENYGDPKLFDKAWPLLRAAASGRPQDPLLYAKVAEALESASQTAEAEEVYRLSLEQDPEQLDVLLRLAALLERSGKHTEAAALHKRAVAILPRLSE
jgi:hypothetical protein